MDETIKVLEYSRASVPSLSSSSQPVTAMSSWHEQSTFVGWDVEYASLTQQALEQSVSI